VITNREVIHVSNQDVKFEARDLVITYERNEVETLAVKGLNLQIRAGEFVCIVGPSGCGKTTFLNVVSGLLNPRAGEVLLDGRPFVGPGRERGQVFQSPNLLPWRTVLGNVSYSLELQGVPRSEREHRAMSYIKLVGLAGFERHFPRELSGGMQQRVNLARALVAEPQVLLLDEPFAALDAQTREFMQKELLRIWQETRNTTIFITHQINEAIYLADRVLVMTARPGRIKEVVPIDLPRPRTLGIKREAQFLAYEEQIWQMIEEEVINSGQLTSAGAAK
jgi:NitT/TauT family transport system ATP-binding protein